MSDIRESVPAFEVPHYLSVGTLPQVEECLITPDIALTDLHTLPKCLDRLRVTGGIRTDLLTQVQSLVDFDADCILFTAFSALPLADLFRGLFQELGIAVPEIGYVYTSRLKHSLPPHISIDVRDKKVAVVDQYFASGGTVVKSIGMAASQDAIETHVVTGRWYAQANQEPLRIDPERVTSTLAPQLTVMGRKIAALSMQGGLYTV